MHRIFLSAINEKKLDGSILLTKVLGLNQAWPDILLGGILGTLFFLALRTAGTSRGGAILIPLVGSSFAALAIVLWLAAGSSVAVLFGSAALATLLLLLLIFGAHGKAS